MSLVSVVIPAFNAGGTLARTLRSVQDQTHSELEIFVVEDGSKDDTAAIAMDHAKSDQRISILWQENAGVAAARNCGLAQAAGRYTAWLDADDIWHPTKIEKQLAVFRQAASPLSFVYTGYRLIDEDDRIIPNFRTMADVAGSTLCRQIATNFFSNVSSIMAPTTLARRIGGYDPRLRAWGIEGAEDLLLQLQLAAAGPAGCCREALVGYRMHRQNMSFNHARAARSNLKAVQLTEVSETDAPEWVFRLGSARTVGYCLHQLQDGDVHGALSTFWTIFRNQPAYTLLTMALIGQWQLKKALFPKHGRDPEVGRHFLDADPVSVPWLGHMLLTGWHRRRLEAADAQRVKAQVPEPTVRAIASRPVWLHKSRLSGGARPFPSAVEPTLSMPASRPTAKVLSFSSRNQ